MVFFKERRTDYQTLKYKDVPPLKTYHYLLEEVASVKVLNITSGYLVYRLIL